MRYYSTYLRKLHLELADRYAKLVDSLTPTNQSGQGAMETGILDTVRVRLAIDDFKTILSEIKRIK